MKILLLSILSSIFLMASCHKEDIILTNEDGVIVSMPFQWKQSLHLSEPVSNSSITAPIYYKGNIVSPVTNGGTNRLLALINSSTGDIIWTWDDRFSPDTEYEDIKSFYQFGNLLTYQTGSRSYCINLDNGDTFWKYQRDFILGSRLTSNIENTFFYDGTIKNEVDYNEGVAFLCDINNGVISEFLRVNYSRDYINPTNLVGAVTNVLKLPDRANLYAITYMEPLPNWEVHSFLGLYNSDTEVWEFERKLMAAPTQNSSVYWPQIYKDKLYASVGKNLVCHDLASGEQVWSRQFSQDFLFSGFIIVEDKLIGSNEDQMLYCLNPENGNIIWQTAGSGTSSRLSYLNGIVYFAGGADGKLHGVDISNGKTVWLLDADNIDGTIFASYNPVYVFPAEGNQPAKVIAHTLGNVVCFEAYQ